MGRETMTTAAKERPIPFSGEMVRAILEGRKTQTRRIVKPPPVQNEAGLWLWKNPRLSAQTDAQGLREWLPEECPYGQPGDRLYVREEIRFPTEFNDLPPRDVPEGAPVYYCADAHRSVDLQWGKKRPPMFAPKWTSRLTLEITEVRVERLQDISEEDARAEGVYRHERGFFTADLNFKRSGLTAVEAFRALWEAINGAGSWDANPWVWVIEFRRIEA